MFADLCHSILVCIDFYGYQRFSQHPDLLWQFLLSSPDHSRSIVATGLRLRNRSRDWDLKAQVLCALILLWGFGRYLSIALDASCLLLRSSAHGGFFLYERWVGSTFTVENLPWSKWLLLSELCSRLSASLQELIVQFCPWFDFRSVTKGTPARRLLVKKSVSPLYRCSWHQETPSFEVNQDEPTAYGNTSSEWSADHLRTLVLVCLVVFAESPLIVMDALWPSFSLKPGMWLSSRWWMGTQSFLIDTFWPQIGSQHDVPPRWIKGASVMESILWQSAKCWRILALCQLQRTMGLWGELLLGVETRQHAHREAENPAFGGVFLCLKIVSMPSWRSHLLQS